MVVPPPNSSWGGQRPSRAGRPARRCSHPRHSGARGPEIGASDARVRLPDEAQSMPPKRALPTAAWSRQRAAPLAPGTPAPDFTLHSTPDQTVSLREFRGRPLILAFYPADWSPVCGDQMALYQEILPEFHRLGADLIGISVDGVWCHLAFA